MVKAGGMSLADALKKAKSGQTVVIDGTVKSELFHFQQVLILQERIMRQ